MGRKTPKQPPTQFTMQFFMDASGSAGTTTAGAGESPFDLELRALLSTVLKDAAARPADPLDRVEVAARMSRALGREVTKTYLDQVVAAGYAGTRRIHVDDMKALCQVTGDFRPLHKLVEACGFKALAPDEAACAEFGALMAVQEQINSRKRAVTADLRDTDLVQRLLSRLTGEVVA